MVELTIRCVCGENFNYNLNITPLLQELESVGLLPLIISHKDHFVTVYIDRQLKIRSVERVILVDKDQRTTVSTSESLTENEIKEIINEIKSESNPNKDYFKFVSALLYKIQEPEALFIGGKQIGYEMWMELRNPIIKLGATYQPIIDLILKSELKPILDKAGKVKLNKNNQLVVDQCIAPQFVIGLAQGILLGIGEIAEEKLNIKIEYEIKEDMVSLVLLKEQ